MTLESCQTVHVGTTVQPGWGSWNLGTEKPWNIPAVELSCVRLRNNTISTPIILSASDAPLSTSCIVGQTVLAHVLASCSGVTVNARKTVNHITPTQSAHYQLVMLLQSNMMHRWASKPVNCNECTWLLQWLSKPETLFSHTQGVLFYTIPIMSQHASCLLAGRILVIMSAAMSVVGM